MSKYINADKFIIPKGTIDDIAERGVPAIHDLLDIQPSADVRENIHGENRNDKYAGCDQFICSNCGIELQGWDRIVRASPKFFDEIWEFDFNFCPNCGADMQGETE